MRCKKDRESERDAREKKWKLYIALRWMNCRLWVHKSEQFVNLCLLLFALNSIPHLQSSAFSDCIEPNHQQVRFHWPLYTRRILLAISPLCCRENCINIFAIIFMERNSIFEIDELDTDWIFLKSGSESISGQSFIFGLPRIFITIASCSMSVLPCKISNLNVTFILFLLLKPEAFA